MEKKYSHGFTLTELIIVVSIIGFLAVLALIYLRTQTFKGTDAKRKSDIKNIQVAVEEYEKDHECYPLPQVVTCQPGTGLSPYMSKIPCDPTTKASYYYEYDDSLCPRWYKIYAKLDNTKDIDAAVGGIGPYSAYNYYQGSPNAPSGTSGPTATPGPSGEGGGGEAPVDFYGCVSGVCVPISWDDTRPGPACDPNYQSSTCYGQCTSPQTECMPWQ